MNRAESNQTPTEDTRGKRRASADGGEESKNLDVAMAICPYFIRDRGQGRVSCEIAHFRYPDTLTRREIVYRYCAHPQGYRDCPLKQALDHYYERRYEDRG